MFKKNAGKVIGGGIGAMLGRTIGGIGVVACGTGFGIPMFVVSLGLGIAGSKVGGEIGKFLGK